MKSWITDILFLGNLIMVFIIPMIFTTETLGMAITYSSLVLLMVERALAQKEKG